MPLKKLFVYDKTLTLASTITVLLIPVASVVLMFCGIIKIDFLIIGAVFLIISLILLLVVVFGKSVLNIAILEPDTIKVSTIFGKKLKHKQWLELKSIKVQDVKGRHHSGKYIYLNFSDKNIAINLLSDLLQEEDLILIAYSSKNLETIKHYVGVSVEGFAV